MPMTSEPDKNRDTPSPADSGMPPSSPPPQEPPPKHYTGHLRSDLELFRGEPDIKGNPTWVIFDPVADSYFKIDDAGYRMIQALSGNMEIEEYIRKLHAVGINADSPEVIKLIKFLQDSNLFVPRYLQTENRNQLKRAMKKKMFRHSLLSGYLFFKIPIAKPDRFLSRTVDTIRLVFNKWVLACLWIIAITGYIGLVMNWHKFTEKFIASISLQGLARYTLAVIAVKFIHEFAHAYTAKINGVRVRRMGIAIVFFVPRLYTDLTDSWRIHDWKKRFLIDGAGIISEILIGGMAALVWVNTTPGLTHSIAYFIFAVSIINTVLINGNPFIRYDGYFMLMDLTGIDNLQQRAVDRTRYLWRKFLFGLDLPSEDRTTGWKRYFLAVFGVASFCYRIFLYTSIILLVYFQFPKVIGIVLLGLEVYSLVLKPLSGEIRFLTMMRTRMNRRKSLLSYSGFAVILLVFFLPLPWDVRLPCEVRPADSERIYARSGFLEDIRVEDGQRVGKGQILFVQSDPYLAWRLREALIESEQDETVLDQAQGDVKRLGEIKIDRRALESSRNLVNELKRRQAQMTLKSGIDGVFAFYDHHLKPGKWLRKGEVIGEVFTPDRQEVNAYVGEDEMRKLKIGDRVKFCLESELHTYPGEITAVSDVAAELEPTPLLDVFGGNILSNQAPGREGFKPLEPLYQVTVKVDSSLKLPVGCSGAINIRKYSSVGGNIVRKVIHVLQRELSF
ncbi:MAG: HlyD family efflux transporter periplasmic adaptor subunit [Victivallales bacterium]|nr:HlyD family efflux transporter periplasmic adaptor subunit [Victivallales bacterium]